LEEIVEEILINLPPRKGTSRAELTNAVRQAMKQLREQVPWQMKLLDRAAMKNHARKVFAAAMELEFLLDTSPGMMQAMLFSKLEVSPHELQSEQAMRKAYQKRSEAFFEELYDLHLVCAMAARAGTHGNSDPAKFLSARSAHGLMQNHSVAKITGTQDGPFRTVTSLLYEVLSGHRNVDLKRACDAVLQAKKRMQRTGAEAPIRRGGK
jgi:hypothetical protein